MRIASGNYAYYLDGEDTSITESWTIDKDADGKIIVHAIRDAQVFQSRIEVSAIKQSGLITSFQVTWENGGDGMVRHVHTDYQISQDIVNVSRAVNGNKKSYTFNYPIMPIISPLMRVFMGDAIVKLSKQAEGATVLIPNITDPTNAGTLLLPKIEQRQAKMLHAEELELAGQSISGDCYSYTGELYDENARFWLDEHFTLLRYTWGQWDVFLDRYERMT